MPMASLPSNQLQRSRLRSAKVSDVLPSSLVPPASGRGLESAALLLPGRGPFEAYLAELAAARSDFAEWDGRLLVAPPAPPDEAPAHRLLIVDRYGQVYWTGEALSADELPNAAELTEWFKFLATSCPECGVLDDPTDRDWVP